MSLKSQTLGGLKWTSISTVLTTIFHLSTIILLTRFLSAEDFGVFSILMVIIGFSQAFADMGMSNAIIQRPNVSHSQLSSLYWLNIASGLILSIIIALAAPFIAAFYDAPSITALLWTLSGVFFITAIGNQYRVLCQKELLFNQMAIIEVLSAGGAFVLIVALTIAGYGIYAPVLGMLAQASLSSAGFLMIGIKHHHRPALIYKHSEIKDFFSFGLYQMGEKSINYLSANIDNLLIGKFIGMQALGFYNLAWQLCIFPVQKINPIINKVAFPIYSKLQDNHEELSLYYNRFMQGVAVLTTPLLVFLFYFSDETTHIIYGQGWNETSHLVVVLAVIGIIKAIGNPAGSLFLALGRADIGFWWNVVWLISLGGTLSAALLLSPSLHTVVWVLLGLSLFFSVFWHMLVMKIAHISYKALIISLFRVISFCFMIGGIGYLVATTFNVQNPLFMLFVAGGVCLALYLPYIYIFERSLLHWVANKQDI